MARVNFLDIHCKSYDQFGLKLLHINTPKCIVFTALRQQYCCYRTVFSNEIYTFFPWWLIASGTRNSKEKGSSWNSAGKQLFQWRMQGEKLGASLGSEVTSNCEPLCPVRRIWRQKWCPQPTLFLLSKVRNHEWCTFPAIKNESWKMRPWKNISFKSRIFPSSPSSQSTF